MNTKEELIQILQTYPAKIESRVIAILDRKKAINQLRDVMSAREFSIKGDVAEDAKKEDWKKALSNETLRKTELINRLGVDEKYQNAKRLLDESNEDEIAYIEAETSRLRREYETAKVLLPLLYGAGQ